VHGGLNSHAHALTHINAGGGVVDGNYEAYIDGYDDGWVQLQPKGWRMLCNLRMPPAWRITHQRPQVRTQRQ
jgi:hypothetical protein